MRRALYIILAAVALVASCRGPRKIPRAEIEDIFYEMLLQDQFIKQSPALKKEADTSLVYEGIFREHGYSTDDYLFSLRYYLEEPEKMGKVMGSVAARLERELKVTRDALALERWQRKMMAIYRQHPDTTHLPKQGVRPVDTLKVQMAGTSVILQKPVDSLQLIPQDSLLYLRDSL